MTATCKKLNEFTLFSWKWWLKWQVAWVHPGIPISHKLCRTRSFWSHRPDDSGRTIFPSSSSFFLLFRLPIYASSSSSQATYVRALLTFLLFSLSSLYLVTWTFHLFLPLATTVHFLFFSLSLPILFQSMLF